MSNSSVAANSSPLRSSNVRQLVQMFEQFSTNVLSQEQQPSTISDLTLLLNGRRVARTLPHKRNNPRGPMGAKSVQCVIL